MAQECFCSNGGSVNEGRGGVEEAELTQEWKGVTGQEFESEEEESGEGDKVRNRRIIYSVGTNEGEGAVQT